MTDRNGEKKVPGRAGAVELVENDLHEIRGGIQKSGDVALKRGVINADQDYDLTFGE